jgi:hypothetical protein
MESKMDIDDCKTVKDCFLWAEQEWPTFWDFVNQHKMTKHEILELAKSIESEEDKFDKLTEKLIEVGSADKSQEALRLLVKGSGSFIALERTLHEYTTTTKRPNKNR